MFYTDDELSDEYVTAMCAANTGYPLNSGASYTDWYGMLDMGGPL